MKDDHNRRFDFDCAVMSSATESTIASTHVLIRLSLVSKNAEKGTEQRLCAPAPCGSDNSLSGK